MNTQQNKTKQVKNIREYGLVGIILLLGLVFTLINPSFISTDNLIDLLRNSSILIIISTAMMRVLITGGIDLSVSAILAFSGMITAIAVRDIPGLHPLVAILMGTLIGGACGLLNGFLIAKLKVLPLIATLSVAYILRGTTFIISDGEWVSANQMSDSFQNIATGETLFINNLILIAAVILIISYYLSAHTKLGRRMYAIGSNLASARVSGINITGVIMITYMLMGMMDGLSGVLWVSKFASAQPDSAINYELTVIATCVLGGVSITGGSGKVSGVLFGGIIMGMLSNGLPIINVSSFWQNAIQGLIILLAVLINVLYKRRIDKVNIEKRAI